MNFDGQFLNQTKIVLDTVRIDPYNMYNAANGTWTIPEITQSFQIRFVVNLQVWGADRFILIYINNVLIPLIFPGERRKTLSNYGRKYFTYLRIRSRRHLVLYVMCTIFCMQLETCRVLLLTLFQVLQSHLLLTNAPLSIHKTP